MVSRIHSDKSRSMRSKTLALLLVVVAICSTARGQNPRATAMSAPAHPKRIIVISLDGLDARYLNKRDEYKLRIPTLRRLMANGATASGVVSVYPSVTYPAHTTIVTGALPARHGIVGNENFEPPEVPQTGELLWYASSIKVDTLWNAAARRKLKTAMVSWPVSTGAGDYNFPEIFKLDGSFEETREIIKANDRPDGLVEELEEIDPLLYSNVTEDEGDDMRTRFAEYIAAEKRPDLLLVHLFDLDHFQHDFGPFTPEAFEMLEKADTYVARILAAAERAGTLNDTAIFIVSDHGFMPVKQRLHPGVLLQKAGLISMKNQMYARGSEYLFVCFP